jgi:hypothetical protein
VPLDLSGTPYTSQIPAGPVAESIVENAGQAGCDLVVLCQPRHGRDGEPANGLHRERCLESDTPVQIVK